jgi:hypothetical protein
VTIHVHASNRHGDCQPSESSHTAAWFCCLALVSLSSSDKWGKATVILSTQDFTRTDGRVKTVVDFHVFSVAGRPVAGDSVARVREASRQLKIIRAAVVDLTPNSQPEGPGYHFSSASTPLTCPAREAVAVATLPSTYLSGLRSFCTFGARPGRFSGTFRKVRITLDVTSSLL